MPRGCSTFEVMLHKVEQRPLPTPPLVVHAFAPQIWGARSHSRSKSGPPRAAPMSSTDDKPPKPDAPPPAWDYDPETGWPTPRGGLHPWNTMGREKRRDHDTAKPRRHSRGPIAAKLDRM